MIITAMNEYKGGIEQSFFKGFFLSYLGGLGMHRFTWNIKNHLMLYTDPIPFISERKHETIHSTGSSCCSESVLLRGLLSARSQSYPGLSFH